MSDSLMLNADGAERLRYNAAGFPVRTAHGALSVFSQYAAACHWHRDYELLLAERGGMDYFVNGEIVHVGEGQGMFVNSGRLHYGFSPAREECLFSVLVFHPSLLGEEPLPTAAHAARLSGDGQRDWLLLDRADDDGRRALALTRRIVRLCDRGDPLYEFAVQGACGALLATLYRMARPRAGGAASDPAWQALRRMTGYLQANCAGSVRLKDVAAAGAVCRSRCCALFRARLGQTPMEYLTCYRLEQAVQLLRDGEMTITEIARSVGFDGASYFAERFRERYGLSPRAYREQARASGAPPSP